MLVISIEETSYKGMFRATLEKGSAFFIRKEYLSSVNFEELCEGYELSEEQHEELLDAGLCCVVELKAVEYLARAEQSRFGLNRKLKQKGYNDVYIKNALDFLEQANYLSDERYARAWLNTRKINHYEGHSRLLSELLSRGIPRDVAQNALQEFFTENDEDEICLKAYAKAVKNKKSGDKLIAALIKSGFTLKQIHNAESQQEI